MLPCGNFVTCTMKKTDRDKYLSIFVCFVTLLAFFLGYKTIAALISIPATFLIGFTKHKSGNLFKVALFTGLITAGFVTDFPFNHFPPALIFLPLMGVGLQLRTWFFSKLFLYKGLIAEMVLLLCLAGCFGVGAFLSNYTWQQWLSGGVPALIYGWFSTMIYSDRNASRIAVSKVNTSIGRQAPDFVLNDQFNNTVSLSALLKESHVLLIFVRGDWCPTCHMMIRGYLKNKEKFGEKNIRIVGIGPDPVGVNKDIMSRFDEQSLMLSDENQETALKYSMSLQENNPVTKSMYSKGIPLPASFLVHRNGSILYTSRSDRAAEILQPEKIFEVIDQIK